MKTHILNRALLFLAAAGLLSAWTAPAVIIYNNSTNDLTARFNPGTLEVGDQISLASTERYLQAFSFQFWGTNTAGGGTFSGSPEVKVRFYVNDGADFNGYASPGTMFFDSGWQSLGLPTDRSTMLFAGADFTYLATLALVNPMPVQVTNFTWSLQFRNMGGTDQVGVDLFSPPVAGQNFSDYWENNGGTWSLKTNIYPMDFAAVFDATVPEPSGLALGILGGMALLVGSRWLRRR